jgi:hypothetical protein
MTEKQILLRFGQRRITAGNKENLNILGVKLAQKSFLNRAKLCKR